MLQAIGALAVKGSGHTRPYSENANAKVARYLAI